jgi:hypothetical protein
MHPILSKFQVDDKLQLQHIQGDALILQISEEGILLRTQSQGDELLSPQDAETATLTFKTLRKKINRKDFQYNQILREGNLAIYEQFSKKLNKIAGYEVIRISLHKAYKIQGIEFPAGESYPGDSQWGTMGWTFTDLEKAKHKFATLKALPKDQTPPIQDTPPPSPEPEEQNTEEPSNPQLVQENLL